MATSIELVRARVRRGLLAGAPIGILVVLATAAPAVLAQSTGIACTCRANGRSYALGARACIRTPDGFRIAQCRMVQNVTSWLASDEGCVVSALRRTGTDG